MTKAQKLFSHLFWDSIQRWGVIHSFRRVGLAGIPAASNRVERESRLLARKFTHSPEWAHLFKDRARFRDEGGEAMAARTLVERALTDFHGALDAATIVFAHSILDDLALDACHVTMLQAPRDWAPFFSKRKVELADVENQTHDQLLSKMLADHLEVLDRKSLLAKLEHLTALCRPPPNFEGVKGFRLDQKRLVALDNLRHRIVHDGAIEAIPSIDEDLEFMGDVSRTFVALIHHRYGLQVDPRAFPTSSTSPE